MSKKTETTNEEDVAVQRIAKYFFSLVVFSGVIFGGYKAISQENILPIKEISISGEFQEITAQELHELIVDGVTGNFFTLSVEDIYRKFYALPWVEKIWVHRVWPDKINIEIHEHKPVAVLKNKGLLNDKGNVFITEAKTFSNELPVFNVANNYEQQAIKQYRQYKRMLEHSSVAIRSFKFDERKSQTLLLSNNVNLKLGRVETEKRLQRFIDAYDAVLSEKVKKIDNIDLRYTNGFAIKWKQV